MEQTCQTAEIARAEQMRALEETLNEQQFDCWKVRWLIEEMAEVPNHDELAKRIADGAWLPINSLSAERLQTAYFFCQHHLSMTFYVSDTGHISVQDSRKSCYSKKNPVIKQLRTSCNWRKFIRTSIDPDKMRLMLETRAKMILEKDVADGCFLSIEADCNYMRRMGYELDLHQYQNLYEMLRIYDDLDRKNEFISLDELAEQTDDFNFDDEKLLILDRELVMPLCEDMENPLLAEDLKKDASSYAQQTTSKSMMRENAYFDALLALTSLINQNEKV